MADSHFPLRQLPNELQGIVTNNMSIPSVLRLCQTNTHYRDHICNNDTFWRIRRQSLFGPNESDVYLAYYFQRLDDTLHLTDLYFSWAVDTDDEGIIETLLYGIFDLLEPLSSDYQPIHAFEMQIHYANTWLNGERLLSDYPRLSEVERAHDALQHWREEWVKPQLMRHSRGVKIEDM